MKNSLSIEIVQDGSFINSLAEIEKQVLIIALEMFKNRAEVARVLGIGRSTLYRKINEHDLCEDKKRQRKRLKQLAVIRQEKERHEANGTLLVAT